MADIDDQRELLNLQRQISAELADKAKLQGEIVTKRQQEIEAIGALQEFNESNISLARQAFELEEAMAAARSTNNTKAEEAAAKRLASLKAEIKDRKLSLEIEVQRGKTTQEQMDAEISSMEEALDMRSKSRDELKAYIADQKLFNDVLEEEETNLQKLQKAYSKAKKATDGVADSMAGLLGVQRFHNLEALGQESFFGPAGSEAVKAQIDSLKENFNIINMSASALKGMAEQVLAFSELTATMQKATGMSRAFAAEIYDTREAANVFAGAIVMTNEEVGNFQQALYETLPAFSRLDEGGRQSLTTIGSLLGELGVDANDFAEAINQMAMTTGAGVDEAGAHIMAATDEMNQLGITPRTFISNLARMTPQFARFGRGAIDILKKAMKQSKALNVEVESLIGAVEGFETFEDASQKAAMLNATMLAVGASTESMVDAMGMIMERDPTKKFEMLRNQYHELQKSTGMTFRQMSEDQGKFGFLLDELVDQSGKSAQEFINMFDLMGEETLTAAEKQQSLVKTIVESQTASDLFAATVQSLMPYIKELSLFVTQDLVPGFAIFLQEFGGIIKAMGKAIIITGVLVPAIALITGGLNLFRMGAFAAGVSFGEFNKKLMTAKLTTSAMMGGAFGMISGVMLATSEGAGFATRAIGGLTGALGALSIAVKFFGLSVKSALIASGVGMLIAFLPDILQLFGLMDTAEERTAKAEAQQKKQMADMEKRMKEMQNMAMPTFQDGAGGPQLGIPDSGFNFVDPPSFHRGGTAKLKSGEIMMTSGPGTTDMSVLSQATVTALTSVKGNGGESKELAKEIAKALEPIFGNLAQTMAMTVTRAAGANGGYTKPEFDVLLDGKRVGKALMKNGVFNSGTDDSMGL